MKTTGKTKMKLYCLCKWEEKVKIIFWWHMCSVIYVKVLLMSREQIFQWWFIYFRQLCCFHSLHPLQPPSQTLVFLQLLLFSLPDVFVIQDCHIYHYSLFLVSTTTITAGSLSCLSVCVWKSHRTLPRSFSATFGGLSHFDLEVSSPTLAQMFLFAMSLGCNIPCTLYLLGKVIQLDFLTSKAENGFY